ncbi:hypothetical protein LX32DRAFT_646066 [Colletotrichum zoysiae]|uniref:Uncharacterized protein n=1 Tax=Colletotrichum zoysiae TaxID=1216348 RepID=A0AAD9LTY7_9PEZI|nr:hypothetical protein LX32DRAFT_646066 [Colletotrichum zoysiae]
MEGSARFQGHHNRAIQICHFSASSTWSRALVEASALAAEQSVYQMYGCHPHPPYVLIDMCLHICSVPTLGWCV